MNHGVLVLLRHGESTANAAQEFTGLLDVGLTPLGCEQARRAAQMLAADGCRPHTVVTSPMLRATLTTNLVLRELSLDDDAVVASWRLAERDYGCLTGIPKAQALARYGPERYISVRRTMDGVPAPATSQQISRWDRAFTDPGSGLPAPGEGESLRDVITRVAPCWHRIRERVLRGETVLVVAHGNSLRALCTVVDDLGPADVEVLNIPPGQPLRYDVGPDGTFTPRGGHYLDAPAAREAAERIAHEGGT
jgi:2,3-bisphosphoglycerate-dependent phosphoglycerate mutase